MGSMPKYWSEIQRLPSGFLDFPPVKLNVHEKKTSVKFQNPLIFYKQLSSAVDVTSSEFRFEVISTGHKNNVSKVSMTLVLTNLTNNASSCASQSSRCLSWRNDGPDLSRLSGSECFHVVYEEPGCWGVMWAWINLFKPNAQKNIMHKYMQWNAYVNMLLYILDSL